MRDYALNLVRCGSIELPHGEASFHEIIVDAKRSGYLADVQLTGRGRHTRAMETLQEAVVWASRQLTAPAPPPPGTVEKL